MRAVGVSGTFGYAPDVAFKTTTEAMRAVGNNTGNLVFQYAVHKAIDEKQLLIGKDTSWNPSEIRERCRIIVIPSANFIREGFDIGGFVDALEATQLPLLFLGVGAQSTDFSDRDYEFHPSVVKLMHLIRERSEFVAIRGEYTARVLEKYGVTNWKITGCPSNFINPSPNLAKIINAKTANPLRSFITHGDEPWPKTKDKQIVERTLAEWTQNGPAMQSQQSVPVFMEFIRRNNPYSTEMVPEKRETSLKNALMPHATMEEFQDYLAAKLRVYFCVHQWLEDSSKYDFSVGLRLHGNMVAWQAGVPSLWLYHDSRTRELAETMAVPHISYTDFIENCPTVQSAYDRCKFDPDVYTQRRKELADRYCAILRSAEIRSAPYLAFNSA